MNENIENTINYFNDLFVKFDTIQENKENKDLKNNENIEKNICNILDETISIKENNNLRINNKNINENPFDLHLECIENSTINTKETKKEQKKETFNLDNIIIENINCDLKNNEQENINFDNIKSQNTNCNLQNNLPKNITKMKLDKYFEKYKIDN